MTVGEPIVIVIGAGYNGKRLYYERLGVLTFFEHYAGEGRTWPRRKGCQPRRRQSTRDVARSARGDVHVAWAADARGSARPFLDELFTAAADMGR